MRRSGRWFVAAIAVMFVVPASAFAGPVILGGDDLTEHGQTDGAGNNEEGWLYMERSVGNLLPNVTRANDNSIAALGSTGPLDPDSNGGDAGAGITSAAGKNGMTVQFFDGDVAIANALGAIADGSYNPAIIWVAGDGADNDLDGCDGAGTEGQALIDQAGVINQFVTDGGGLFSHGTCYAWLTSLLPSVTTVDGGSSDDLYRTAEGVAAFPGVSDADFNAGPWHNHFEGDFGGLQVLVRSSDIDDATGTDAAVVLGGGDVDIIPVPPTAPLAAACSNAVTGDSGNNKLTGTEGGDQMKGLVGNDTLTGLGGDDCIRGGPGADKESGGDGNDQLNGGQKKDKLSAGGGDDLVKVRAGRSDTVNCGAGDDTVRAGRNDKINDNCEDVRFG
jgi:hypothetical protein